MSLTRRLSRGLQLLASYTYAKSIDNASGNVGGLDTTIILGNQLDDRANRGVSDFDRTHRFVLSYLWDLPRPAFTAEDQRPDGCCCPAGRWRASSPRCRVSRLTSWIPPRAPSISEQIEQRTLPAQLGVGATRATAISNVPPGYFFNPFAFVRPVVQTGQSIPSSNGTAARGRARHRHWQRRPQRAARATTGERRLLNHQALSVW